MILSVGADLLKVPSCYLALAILLENTQTAKVIRVFKKLWWLTVFVHYQPFRASEAAALDKVCVKEMKNL